jgi:thioredoxin-dependent peroxiredoxin
MPLSINDVGPDFTAASTEGPLHFYDWAGDNWVLFFSHPKDFTPVCTTELGAVAKLKPEFDKRGVKVLGLSVDPVENHTEGTSEGRTPANNATVRNVFIIGPDKRIKLVLVYPMTTGRNFDEILRVIDSMQLTARHKVATPADWKQGGDVIITGAVSDEEAKSLFPGYKTHKPYLRTTQQPK